MIRHWNETQPKEGLAEERFETPAVTPSVKEDPMRAPISEKSRQETRNQVEV